MVDAVLSDRTLKARKVHYCETCETGRIQPSQEYRKTVYVYDGRIYSWVQCDDCRPLQATVYDWRGEPDEGVGRDDYIEWADEHPNDERAVAYLARVRVPA